MKTATRALRALLATSMAVGALWATGAGAQAIPPGWQASHMQPLAHLTLPGPRAFKLSIKQYKGRWYLFVAEGGQNAAFKSGLTKSRLTATAVQTVDGYDYVEGRPVRLTVYRADSGKLDQ